MRVAESLRRRLRRHHALAAVALLALAAGLGLLPWLRPGGAPRAVAAGAGGEVVAQTDDSVPARSVTMFGASPGEAPDETWGIGRELGATVIVRYTDSGWSVAGEPEDAAGVPLAHFTLDQPEAGRYSTPSPLAGQMAEDGSGALLGRVEASGESREVVLVRDPGGQFKEAPAPPTGEEEAGGEVALRQNEDLFGVNDPPLLAALAEGGGHAGALVVPVDENGEHIEDSVLHWNGTRWAREQIEVPAASSKEFQVIAIAASSPGNAWLLARLSNAYPSGSLALFKRVSGESGEPAVWRPVAPAAGAEPGEPLKVPVEGAEAVPLVVSAGTQSQILTVREGGVWVDGLRADDEGSVAMLFKPEGENGGQVVRAWCETPPGVSFAPKCAGALPAELPHAGGRSFAWADSSTPDALGRRVITGLETGESLRLEGSEFVRVSALGGTPNFDVGGAYGAAFANDHEGWLGQQLLPVHLTQKPLASRLAQWPVPFRHALLALAPQPGAPVGALTSQVLAVGDDGEVGRFVPGAGWQPESLLDGTGHHQTPRLRSVSWPTSGRAFAVGDEGAMWLWRGETGLWEPDPAAPLNFRGNLLGVAFDPTNSSRGYAVGESGLLLRYGKSWQQDELPAEAPCTPRKPNDPEEKARCSTWSDASFTSVAFAGSQAIVAYKVLLSTSSQQYRGGLIVNDGSGWHIDGSAAAAVGEDNPWAVAGLPDGGAGFTAAGVLGGAKVFERDSAGGEWHVTATPYPGLPASSLTLFRESGALRAITAGTVPQTAAVESVPPPPAGFPPNLLTPYPITESPEQGVLRQTAGGWSDEEHELNNQHEPPGEYTNYDTPYQPDPIAGVLVSGDGTQGWAVGGVVSSQHPQQLDTADAARYPADGSAPLGAGTSTLAVNAPGDAVFAVGGGAQCEAACAALANAGIGPDRWLSAALARTATIAGVRNFIYTGPRVSSGHRAGPSTEPLPYERELGRYSQLLTGQTPPVLPVISPSDLEGGSEARFEGLFAPVISPQPFRPACGAVPTEPGTYYATSSSAAKGVTVRVIVLDESTQVGTNQLAWLSCELGAAATNHEPALVAGNADLVTLTANHEGWAQRVAQALVEGNASAYLYDAPEQNVSTSLSFGKNPPVPSFGSGTLGYVSYTHEIATDFHGASGFLIAEVGPWKEGRGAVNVRLIPNIEQLALEAQNGTLLRRSKSAMFAALARRPRAGNRAPNGSTEVDTDPYIPIPDQCVGSCSTFIEPEYTFSSSRKDIGDFVEHVEGSSNPLAVLLGSHGEPVRNGHSGLFCAFNAGTTIVTISTGGLSASLPVTVQAGSVRQPCGTTPLLERPPRETIVPTPTPAPTPEPGGAAPAGTLAPVPLPPAPSPPAASSPIVPHVPAPFLTTTSLPAFIPGFVPPPIPTPARPTPPSGTSPVTSPVEAPEKQEEEEAAPESVSNEAVAYYPHEHEPPVAFLLGLLVLAAFAGSSVRRRPGRSRRKNIEVAPATATTMRSQRRFAREKPRW